MANVRQRCMGRAINEALHPGATCEYCSRLARSPEQEAEVVLHPAQIWNKNKSCKKYIPRSIQEEDADAYSLNATTEGQQKWSSVENI